MNPFPEDGGDPGRMGKPLWPFSRGEGDWAGNSKEKGGGEVMWQEGKRQGKKEGEGGEKGGREVERVAGVKGKIT